jgi:hypothetical protein
MNLSIITELKFMESIDLKDVIFGIGFCIGVIKYIAYEYKYNREESQLFNAVSYGVLCGIRIVLISSFVPDMLRGLVPTIEVVVFVMRAFTKKKYRIRDLDIEQGRRHPPEYRRLNEEMSHVHIE